MYVGTLYGLRVRAKRIRMHPMRGPEEAEVSTLAVSFPGAFTNETHRPSSKRP